MKAVKIVCDYKTGCLNRFLHQSDYPVYMILISSKENTPISAVLKVRDITSLTESILTQPLLIVKWLVNMPTVDLSHF